jgi:hypothetical protein
MADTWAFVMVAPMVYKKVCLMAAQLENKKVGLLAEMSGFLKAV